MHKVSFVQSLPVLYGHGRICIHAALHIYTHGPIGSKCVLITILSNLDSPIIKLRKGKICCFILKASKIEGDHFD